MKKYLIDKTSVDLKFETLKPQHCEYDSIEWKQFVLSMWEWNVCSTNTKLKKRVPDFVAWINLTYNSSTLTENLFMFANNMSKPPICLNCKKLETKFVDPVVGFRKYCGLTCARTSQYVAFNRKNTCIKKYGVASPLQSEIVKAKISETNIKKYGASNPFASSGIKEKIKNTNLDRYGFENPGKCSTVKEKIKNTCLKRYGTTHASKTDAMKKKIKNTCLEKYNVTNVMQDLGILQTSLKNSKKLKSYAFNSGRIVTYQGYENVGINYLLETHNENDIQTCSEHKLVIKYSMDDLIRNYFPDLFVASTNTIYEVKSSWTLKTHITETELKRKACIELGFNFILLLCSKTKVLQIINDEITEKSITWQKMV